MVSIVSIIVHLQAVQAPVGRYYAPPGKQVTHEIGNLAGDTVTAFKLPFERTVRSNLHSGECYKGSAITDLTVAWFFIGVEGVECFRVNCHVEQQLSPVLSSQVEDSPYSTACPIAHPAAR